MITADKIDDETLTSQVRILPMKGSGHWIRSGMGRRM